MPGRKRRTYEEMIATPEEVVIKPTSVWETAIYARLSVENSKKNDDGESIEGQIEICREYIEDHPYLHYVGTFSDNGWTGVNTDRPEFQRMLAGIQNGKIKAVVIKDFSRFSRDYIEAGNLLENIFPALGVRFISVADRYDSFETDGSAASLMIPLKNLINSFYSKDMSKKVSTAVHTKQLAGEHIPSMIPYGYKKSETKAYRFEPDPETAPVVKRIFSMCYAGTGYRVIARTLESEGIPSPGRLRFIRGQTKRTCYADCLWSAQAIKQILTNPTYLGDLVFGRMPTALYLGQPDYHYEPDETKWRRLPDMHEPLVTKEVFNTIRDRMADSREKYNAKYAASEEERRNNPPLFHKMIFCGDCGASLTFHRQGPSYYCRNPQYGRCSFSHNIREDRVKEVVWHILQDQLSLFYDLQKFSEDITRRGCLTRQQTDMKNEMLALSKKISSVQQKRSHLYEDYNDQLISAEDYQFLKQRYDEEQSMLSLRVKEIQRQSIRLGKNLSPENRWLSVMKSLEGKMDLDNELLRALVAKVLIYQSSETDKRIEVVLKYREEFETLISARIEIEGGDAQ
jgi:DNA invertase Pin-like site-specific DNA recombinase